jgi:hypothetical protein
MYFLLLIVLLTPGTGGEQVYYSPNHCHTTLSTAIDGLGDSAVIYGRISATDKQFVNAPTHVKLFVTLKEVLQRCSSDTPPTFTIQSTDRSKRDVIADTTTTVLPCDGRARGEISPLVTTVPHNLHDLDVMLVVADQILKHDRNKETLLSATHPAVSVDQTRQVDPNTLLTTRCASIKATNIPGTWYKTMFFFVLFTLGLSPNLYLKQRTRTGHSSSAQLVCAI